MTTSLAVLYSDASILVIDKPAGVLSIPDRYDPNLPVAQSMLREDWGNLFVVHRLDKDTSGVLVYARTADAHRALSESFEKRSVSKVYQALVRGVPEWDQTSCDLALRPDGDKLHRTIVDAHHGKPSSTDFKVLARYRGAALVEAQPSSGRTHQIRVHLSALGYPCLCDPIYGDGKPLLLSKLKKRWKGDPFDEKPLIERAALHALSATFPHPVSGEVMTVQAPLPKDMKATIAQLEKL